MDTFKDQAEQFVGKKIIIGLCERRKNEEDVHSGVWGIIKSVSESGLLLEVEGGMEEKFWMIPPDLDAIEIANDSEFQFGEDGPIITDIELEAYFEFTENPNLFK